MASCGSVTGCDWANPPDRAWKGSILGPATQPILKDPRIIDTPYFLEWRGRQFLGKSFSRVTTVASSITGQNHHRPINRQLARPLDRDDGTRRDENQHQSNGPDHAVAADERDHLSGENWAYGLPDAGSQRCDA